MSRALLLAAALLGALATVLASSASAQLDLPGNAPSPPEYQVKEDGTLVIGGDVAVSCSQIGLEDPYLMAGGPEARACEAAGFGTAEDPSSGAATPAPSLPETGGLVSVVALVPLTLLVGAVLLTFGAVRRD